MEAKTSKTLYSLCTMFKRMAEFGPDSGGRVKVGSDRDANAAVHLQ